MVFVETTIFCKQVDRLLSADGFRGLQEALLNAPKAGTVIQGTNGLRKIRWKTESGGKRGGVRVIYYYKSAEDRIFLLLMYGKSEKEDLTSDQK